MPGTQPIAPREATPNSTEIASDLAFDTSTPQIQSSPDRATAVGELPITPPQSPRCRAESKASLVTQSSQRSHKEYLDSLQPPSQEEFGRLVAVQEQREKEHKQRNLELRQKANKQSKKLEQARTGFAEAKRGSMDSERHTSVLDHVLSHTKIKLAGQPEEPSRSRSEEVRDKAATVIQRSYRGYRARREIRGFGIDASTRWTHALRDAKWREINQPRSRAELLNGPDGDNGEPNGEAHSKPNISARARQNWKKAATIARRVGGDEDSSDNDESPPSSDDDEEQGHLSEEQKAAMRERKAKAKARRQQHAQQMGLQYFLEMIDLKHRYGSNLRTYHEVWKKENTNENFFYWLDHGEGKNIDLSDCPRERLDREQVRYLTREERQYYLVNVDSQGRLCWAKNGVRIDTTEEWKDSIHGIVPADDPTPAFAPDIEAHSQQSRSKEHHRHLDDHESSNGETDSASESELEAARAAKYTEPSLDDAKGIKKVKHVSAATIFNKLLRKSVRKNTWIFVADTSFRLYVGIKASGAFQHSSFLHGSRISAAGLIKVKNGRLTSLSPLSGHYRPPASNFRAFVHSIRDSGVDMSHVSISKSYAVLVGLEAYVKTRRKAKSLVHNIVHHKDKLLAPEEVKKREEEAKDKSESAELERQTLEKEHREEEKRREENSATVQLIQKLGIRPTTPPGQKA